MASGELCALSFIAGRLAAFLSNNSLLITFKKRSLVVIRYWDVKHLMYIRLHTLGAIVWYADANYIRYAFKRWTRNLGCNWEKDWGLGL